MVPNFFPSSKIVGGVGKMVRQNVTFQESQKTKPIPIVFAIFKDLCWNFEGVVFVVMSNKFLW